jgi:hypothetical protein
MFIISAVAHFGCIDILAVTLAVNLACTFGRWQVYGKWMCNMSKLQKKIRRLWRMYARVCMYILYVCMYMCSCVYLHTHVSTSDRINYGRIDQAHASYFGAIDGWVEGRSDGCIVGWELGVVGFSVGCVLGWRVGWDDGVQLGAVGADDGLELFIWSRQLKIEEWVKTLKLNKCIHMVYTKNMYIRSKWIKFGSV